MLKTIGMNVTEGEIKEIVSSKLEGTDCFIVDIKVRPGKITVLLDKPSGIRVEECAEVNRYLISKLDGKGVLEKCGIEVSSPGMDEPLKVLPQYQRRIGKLVGIITKDGLRREGILKSADENEVVIEETVREKNNGKKTFHIENRAIPMNEVKETKVVFKF
jgi:ribosome maturation factor RimP